MANSSTTRPTQKLHDTRIESRRAKPYPAKHRQKLNAAEYRLRVLTDAHQAATFNIFKWTLDDWRAFLNTPLDDLGGIIKELTTKKKLKAATQKMRTEKQKYTAGKRAFELTGLEPGQKSGVVKNEKIAAKKIEKIKHDVKLRAASILVYSNDSELKKQVLLDVKSRYPELIPEIKSLVKRANDEIKRSTTAAELLKMAKSRLK